MIEDDPVTLSMVAVAGASALAAGGSVMGGINAQKAAGNQATVFKQQAQQEEQAAGAKISGEDMSAIKTQSTVIARAGAAGVTEESATPILSENYTEQKIKDAYTRYSGNLASNADLYQAKLAHYEGKQAFWKGIMGGVTNLLKGAGDIGDIGMKSGGWGGRSSSPGSMTASTSMP